MAEETESSGRLAASFSKLLDGISISTKRKMPDTIWTRIVASKTFDYFWTVVIVSNAIFMGYASDYAMDHVDKDSDMLIPALECAFTVLYTIELFFKLVASRSYFFCGPTRFWNLFEMLLVITGILDQVSTFVFRDETLNMSFMQVLRLLKLVKLMRVLRVVRAFRGLRLIVSSIISSVPVLFWSLVLVLTKTYLFALVFHQSVVDHVTDNPDLETSKKDKLMEYWGSVGQAMLSLYWSGMGGETWRYVAEPLEEISAYCLVSFWFFILFFLFVTYNIITALFIEVTLTASERDDEKVVKEELNKRKKLVSSIQEIWDRFDVNGSGSLNIDELFEGLSDPTLLALFSRLGINVMDVGEFFRLISHEGTEMVEPEAFLVGCMKLMGSARSMDLMALMHWHKRQVKEQRKFQDFCSAELLSIQGCLQELQLRHMFAEI